jgi:anti-anti-sigma factor
VLDIKTEVSGKNVILRCAGRIVRGFETALLCAASRHHGQNIILDLGKADAIDAAGIGALISLQAAGVYLQLMNVPRVIGEVLQVAGLDSVFEVWGTTPVANHEKAHKRVGHFLSPTAAPVN